MYVYTSMLLGYQKCGIMLAPSANKYDFQTKVFWFALVFLFCVQALDKLNIFCLYFHNYCALVIRLVKLNIINFCDDRR